MKKILFIIILCLLVTTPALANSWYFTNQNHNTLGSGYKWLQSSFAGTTQTYSISNNWTGERRFSNGASSNDWAVTRFDSNVTIPAGTWTFSITGLSTASNRSWRPRIKIYDSSGTLIYTSTSPNGISSTSYTNVSWTDYVPSFSVGSGNYYSVEVWSYRTQSGNRTDRFQINAGYSNYIIDTYAPSVYSPYTRSWRWYDDQGSLNPGTPLAGENETPTGMYNHNQVRLRETVSEIGGGSQTGRKKIQYSSDSVNFTDVGAIGSGAVWAYCDGGGTDDSLVSSLLLSTSTTFGPYVENGTAASSYTHLGNTMAEYDFCLQENFALTNTTYYFRIVDVTSGNPIYPEATYNWPTITISDHNLSVAMPNEFVINELNMESAPGPATGSFSGLRVNDYRGTDAGWSLTATATDLQRDGGSETIDIENISLTTETVSPVYAETIGGITLGSGQLNNTTPLNLATATAGNGAGNFIFGGSISFNVPVASVPGGYTGTVTLTIS